MRFARGGGGDFKALELIVSLNDCQQFKPCQKFLLKCFYSCGKKLSSNSSVTR